LHGLKLARHCRPETPKLLDISLTERPRNNPCLRISFRCHILKILLFTISASLFPAEEGIMTYILPPRLRLLKTYSGEGGIFLYTPLGFQPRKGKA